MKLICEKCKKTPLIYFSYCKESEVYAILSCKCGLNYLDLYTLAYDYTDIYIKIEVEKEKTNENIQNSNDEKTNNIINSITEKNELVGFCNTCFENIYNFDLKEHHIEHDIIMIDYKNFILTNKELEKITNDIKVAEDKVNCYLPQMKEMLIKAAKDKNEEKDILKSSCINIDRNQIFYKILKLIYDLYIENKNSNTLTYQIILNLKKNCDYNLNKYNLDLQNINKERFMSFLKSCVILCCNIRINKIYNNYVSSKDELLKMILSLKPLKEFNNDDTPVEMDELIKSNSSIYFGEKSKINNLAYGRGFLFCSSGSHYFGYFKNDFFQSGFGKSINKNGNIYIGEFEKGFANGYGKFITKNGNKYQGEWVDNKLTGFGYITWDNGQLYIGDMSKGVFNGLGELHYKNGNVYKGEFKDGKMEGTGKVIYKNKKEYTGEFLSGAKNGYGIMTWPSKEKYEGIWDNDSFKFGEYFWPNGNIYLGNFQNDSVNGLGTFYNSTLGTMETGDWKDGRRVEITIKDTIPSTRYLYYL